MIDEKKLKQQKREYDRGYYIKNKDKLSEKKKQYYLNNKNRIKEYQREHKDKRKKYMEEYKKEYNLKNKDRLLEQNKEYRLKNQDKIKRKNKIWYINNRYDILKRQRENYNKKKKRDYFLNNKDRILERIKEYSKNPEVKLNKKKYQKDYHQKNKEKIRKQQKEYNLKNKDKVSEWSKKCYYKYRNKRLKQQKEHNLKNKDKISEYGREYRSRPEINLRRKKNGKIRYERIIKEENQRREQLGLPLIKKKRLIFKDINNLIQLKELYLNKKLTSTQIGKIFGYSDTSIRRELHSINIKLRKGYHKDYYRLKTDDGHIVRSSLEREVDNYLFHHQLPHQYDIRICSDRTLRCDFKIGEYFIEVWGLIGVDEYEKRMIKKMEIYQNNHLKLISIFPKDDIHQKLSFLIPLFSKIQKPLFEFIEEINEQT